MAVPAGALNYVRPTAAYRARPWDVAVVSLEAKGPHCILTGHANGQILRLGDPSEFDDEETEE
jgi:hypothetical protein